MPIKKRKTSAVKKITKTVKAKKRTAPKTVVVKTKTTPRRKQKKAAGKTITKPIIFPQKKPSLLRNEKLLPVFLIVAAIFSQAFFWSQILNNKWVVTSSNSMVFAEVINEEIVIEEDEDANQPTSEPNSENDSISFDEIQKIDEKISDEIEQEKTVEPQEVETPNKSLDFLPAKTETAKNALNSFQDKAIKDTIKYVAVMLAVMGVILFIAGVVVIKLRNKSRRP